MIACGPHKLYARAGELISTNLEVEKELQKLFFGIEAPVFAGVVERDVAVSSLFELIDFTGVEWLGVDVNADGALIVFGEIQNLMDGFEGIYVNGTGGIHFVDVGRDEATRASVIGQGVTVFDAEILNL